VTFQEAMKDYRPKACEMPGVGCEARGFPAPLAAGWTLQQRRDYNLKAAKANLCRYCRRDTRATTLLATVASGC